MGAITSRESGAVVESDIALNSIYKYPPRSGYYFGSHFIMGGERFDTPQPEAYLFGENADLNFLGYRPTAFPYPPPQANEPTKTLKSLVNIRKESVRFIKTQNMKYNAEKNCESLQRDIFQKSYLRDSNCNPGNCYSIEFIFDCDAKCSITIYYFCTEEISTTGVKFIPRDGGYSETYHYNKGINQIFSQPSHIFNPNLFSEEDLSHIAAKEQYPVAIHCVIEEGTEEYRQSHTTICVIDRHPDNSYVLRALKQKIFVDGLCYLLQEIYGIENKTINKLIVDEETDDHSNECVICMSETRDTLILPCRHLCLCNSCADSLRYQASNCPICRAPFRALLQVKAVQRKTNSHLICHQNTDTTYGHNIPSGYATVSLIEALNGPVRRFSRKQISNIDSPDAINSGLTEKNLNLPKSTGDNIESTPKEDGEMKRSMEASKVNLDNKKANKDLPSHLKYNLGKKSTSVGNIAQPCSNVALKGTVSSLPDMLDCPNNGNSTSTRSSSDSYSSCSSTKNLLSANVSTASKNIVLDDKTVLHNAVNV